MSVNEILNGRPSSNPDNAVVGVTRRLYFVRLFILSCLSDFLAVNRFNLRRRIESLRCESNMSLKFRCGIVLPVLSVCPCRNEQVCCR